MLLKLFRLLIKHSIYCYLCKSSLNFAHKMYDYRTYRLTFPNANIYLMKLRFFNNEIN